MRPPQLCRGHRHGTPFEWTRMMAHQGDGQAATEEGGVLIPREQRHVLIEGEDVLAAWIGERDIYIPLRPMCEALGIVARAQITRIKRDDVMAERLRSLRLETPGGLQTVQALHLEAVPLWLAGIEPSLSCNLPLLSRIGM